MSKKVFRMPGMYEPEPYTEFLPKTSDPVDELLDTFERGVQEALLASDALLEIALGSTLTSDENLT